MDKAKKELMVEQDVEICANNVNTDLTARVKVRTTGVGILGGRCRCLI
ncbi:MAG: hypothetical protein PHY47_20645 [Lachnospiraceae bacterium]|nr:hypothetical protein [Lachnospiraceae bacterium]